MIAVQNPAQYGLKQGLETFAPDSMAYGLTVTHQYHCLVSPSARGPHGEDQADRDAAITPQHANGRGAPRSRLHGPRLRAQCLGGLDRGADETPPALRQLPASNYDVQRGFESGVDVGDESLACGRLRRAASVQELGKIPRSMRYCEKKRH